jgi:hypothetical protein
MNSRYLEEARTELTHAQREREDQLRSKLQEATCHLQTQPHDTGLQEQQGILRGEVQDLEDWKMAGKRIRWILKGDMVSKEFFNEVQEKPESTTIVFLRNPAGEEIRDKTGL